MKQNNTDIQKMLQNASLLIKKKDYSKAIETCEKILKGLPDNKQAYYLLGLAYKQKGEQKQALHILQKLLKLDPKNGTVHSLVGDIYGGKKQFDKALHHYTLAVENGFETPQVYNVLCSIWKNRGDYDKAFEYCQKSINLKADFVPALLNIGMIHLHNGKKEEVIKTMTHLIEIDPMAYRAYYMLARTQKHKEHNDITRKMESLFSNPNTPEEGLIFLGYGLGKIYEELGEYEKAFEALKTANKLKRAQAKYSTNDAIKKFDRLKTVFNEKYIEQLGKTGFHDKTPIFVVGMPRSGTSLTEQILSSHPSIFGAGELMALSTAVQKYVKKLPPPAEAYENIAKDYIREIRKIDPETEYIVDKQPSNYLEIPYICLAFPDAKIIHCVRDPMDTCFSNYKNYFEQGRPMSNDLIEVGQDYKLYQDLMEHYHKLFPGRIYDVVYEKLVDDQENESRKMLEYCGIPWDDACLSFHKTERTVKTMSSVQVRQPIYKDSVKMWKNYEKQLEPLKKILEGERPMATNKKMVSINGKDFEFDSLSKKAKSELQNIQFARAELGRLKRQQALIQTALKSYEKTLIENIPTEA